MFDCASPSVPRIARATPADEAVSLLMRYGALIIEDAAPTDVLAHVTEELGPWFERAYTGAGPFFGRRTKRFSSVFAKAPSTSALAADDVVLNIIERALKGPEGAERCNAIQLNATQAIGICPGEPAQVLHRDETMYPFAHDYEVMANVMWALDPWTAESGATRIVPGSSSWPRIRLPEPEEIVSATAPAGAAIVWLGSTIHGGGENVSSKIRRGLAFSYSLGWLAQAERLLVTTPPDLARSLPQRLQRLIGYQMHMPNLGWIEERDPLQWLENEFGELAPAEDNLTPMQAALVEWRLASRPAGG